MPLDCTKRFHTIVAESERVKTTKQPIDHMSSEELSISGDFEDLSQDEELPSGSEDEVIPEDGDEYVPFSAKFRSHLFQVFWYRRKRGFQLSLSQACRYCLSPKWPNKKDCRAIFRKWFLVAWFNSCRYQSQQPDSFWHLWNGTQISSLRNFMVERKKNSTKLLALQTLAISKRYAKTFSRAKIFRSLN